MNKIVFFDLDGTLTESKQPLSEEMGALLSRLLDKTNVAITSGGSLTQFLTQVVARLPKGARLERLYLLPTCGAALYEWRENDWEKIYEERLTEQEAAKIRVAMWEAMKETGVVDTEDVSWGERIEYRGGQVTLSALGQRAPIALKKAWDPSHAKRHKLREEIKRRLPSFSVSVGGSTSIDVSKAGVDKAYGVHQLCERLHIQEADALYIGDELEQGGNDEAVYKTAVQTRSVVSPTETAKLIETLLK